VLGAAVTDGTYADTSGSVIEEVVEDVTDTAPDTTPDPTPFTIDPTVPNDDVVDPTDDENVDDTPAIDCSTPAFSPVSPERAAACQ
jgi:hypothetical protein